MTRRARADRRAGAGRAAQPLAVLAQPATGPEPGRVELGIGRTWIGRETVGSGDATETTSSGGALSLFSTSTELAAGSGFEGRVGIKLTRAFELEASGAYAVLHLRTQISGDFENAVSVTATETVQQFTVGGGLLWYVRHHQAQPARVAPFLMAGGGYLRELHEGSVLVETGRFYAVGGGVKFLFGWREDPPERRRPAHRRAGADANGRHRIRQPLSRLAGAGRGALPTLFESEEGPRASEHFGPPASDLGLQAFP